MVLALAVACRPDPAPRPRPDPDVPTGETAEPTTACEAPPGPWSSGDRATARLAIPGFWGAVSAVDFDGDGVPTLAGVVEGDAVVLGPPLDGGARALRRTDARLAPAAQLATLPRPGGDALVLGGGALVTWASTGRAPAPDVVLGLPPLRAPWSVAAGASGLAVGAGADRSGIDPVWWLPDPAEDGALDALAAARIETAQRGAYGHAVGFPGDLTGDGLDDLVVTDLWSLLVFPGGSAGDLVEADAAWRLEGAGFGDPTGPVGDLTGDGVDDLLVQPGPYYGDTVWLVPGGPARRSGELSARATLTFTARGYLPWVAPIDDLDGDGRDDLVFVHEAAGPAELLIVATPPADGRTVDVGREAVARLDLGIPWPNAATVRSLRTVDLDGDCVREVVVGTVDGLYVFAR